MDGALDLGDFIRAIDYVVCEQTLNADAVKSRGSEPVWQVC